MPITGQIDAYFARFPDAAQLRLANKCARERMTVLYDQSAAFDALVAGTSNKSELLLGYGTQFGDMASADQPHRRSLQDAALPLGRASGRARRRSSPRPPTGDLWVGQTDEGELGFSYAEVDRLMVLLVDRRWRRAELIAGRLRRRVRRSGGDADPPQPLQAPHAGDRQALARAPWTATSATPAIGERRRKAEGGGRKESRPAQSAASAAGFGPRDGLSGGKQGRIFKEWQVGLHHAGLEAN